MANATLRYQESGVRSSGVWLTPRCAIRSSGVRSQEFRSSGVWLTPRCAIRSKKKEEEGRGKKRKEGIRNKELKSSKM
ncbi:hypothetical protein AA650_23945 [Anabaena sp. WA102]|jgi:hypothetical protein|nr:hypothetical protein AA650_23945 [Anabaena sp. WA102]